jgi:hypothetical protein
MKPRPAEAIALLLLLAAGPQAFAQNTASLTEGGALFVLLPVGGRAAALGQAAIADGGHSEAAFWNPAGLALLEETELAVHHAVTFASNNTALSGYFPVSGLGVVGFSAYLVDLGSQEITFGPDLPRGRTSPKGIELLASYATTVASDLAVGLNYKLIQFRQDCSGDCGSSRTVVGTTHAVDLGMQYGLANDAVRLGFALQHAGFKLQLENEGQADALPTRVEFGIAYRVMLPQPTGAEEALDARILFDVQDEWGHPDNPDARVGLELGYGDLIRLRSGYAFLQSEGRGPSIGLGMRLGRFAFDFARVFFASSNLDEPVHISLRAIL